MKKVFAVIITIFLVLNAQTAEQIKKQLQDASVTPDQAKQMARDRGMTDQQIESEIKTCNLSSKSKELILKALHFMVWLQGSLEHAKLSIKKLQKSENVDFFMIKVYRRLLYLPEKLFLQKRKK